MFIGHRHAGSYLCLCMNMYALGVVVCVVLCCVVLCCVVLCVVLLCCVVLCMCVAGPAAMHEM